MNHQQNCSEVRPPIKQQTIPVTSAPRHSASDSCDNSDGNRQLRYVPLNIKQDTTRQQIVKTIPAAVGFSSIHYRHRQRPTYDIRFTVRSLEQYQTALLTGYRLTYCTECWKIGHMRDKCQSPVSCRKCLGPYTNEVKHRCQDIFNCAQCGGNHYSLDSICPVVKKYREELKLAVDKALTSRAIKRSIPGEVPRSFQLHANDFP
ncbi:unnamed protein product [Rotaria socialis]|uniref:Gag-like protein n=1 Tax=Rotaria socialis TaxID=392032 RepID=A0A818YMZ6_9BILA|nr:unnamed protein product [Rotaria socialis]CAF4316880.1 unnamed protein product [Rotaria socialis]CAF4633604.1 unnamed protein product [Rotaria socialis]